MNLSENAMKNVLKYVRFDQRASIYLHIPKLRDIEITVPLNLDYFHFEDLSLCIDTVCFDFYEFWNFPIPSPPSKKEVARISNQKHLGNLFFRKIDLSGRWEKKVPIGMTQGEAERKLIDFLMGRFGKIYIRRIKIDYVEDFKMRLGPDFKGKFKVEELHLKIQKFSEFLEVCDFLNQESFPLEKLELEVEKLEDFELENNISQLRNLKIKIPPSISNRELFNFLEKFISLKIKGKLILDVPEVSYLHSICTFLNEKFGTSITLETSTILNLDQNVYLKVFGGEMETFKNHIYDICKKWKMWIFEMELLDCIYLFFREKSKIQQGTSFRSFFFAIKILIYFATYLVVVVILVNVFKENHRSSRKSAIKLSLINLFLIVFEFNPFILEYQKDSAIVRDWLKYTSVTITVTLLILLVTSTVATWIFWRMSKVKPDYDGDEPYEVIYGGEESSTKKSNESTY